MNNPSQGSVLAGNTARMLFATAASVPDRTAVIDGGRSVDYTALSGRAGAIAAGLAEAGIEPGDRVAIRLERSADAAAAFFGVLAAGGIAVTVNELLRPRQIEYIAEHAGAKALLTSADLMARLPHPPEVSAETLLLDELPDREDLEVVPKVGADVAQIIYTSGSTGRPKGVTISHANLWAGTGAVTQYLGISCEDRVAGILPFSFDYGLSQLLCSVTTGAALVVERSPVPRRVVRTLEESAVTVLACVPPLWLQLLGVERFKASPIESLRVMTNTGGRLPSSAVKQLRACQPQAELFLMYGLTEAFRSTYLPPDLVDRKPSSIGRAIPGAEILLLDEELRPCGPGDVGQLVHRGPTVGLGYWRDPEATERVFRANPARPSGAPDSERVVFSGDLVYMDEEGDVFFVGREDAMIKTLGYRVSPDEVVEVLYDSGEVQEAVVSSEPDELRGESIVAYVVLHADGELERLQRFVKNELPRYMQPSRIVVAESLQRTVSGKHDAAATARSTDHPRKD